VATTAASVAFRLSPRERPVVRSVVIDVVRVAGVEAFPTVTIPCTGYSALNRSVTAKAARSENPRSRKYSGLLRRERRPRRAARVTHGKVVDRSAYIHESGYMESESVILGLAALAQSTRLDVFRLLVKHEPKGLPAGQIARDLAVPQNTMSSHLAVLSRAGLVTAQRHGRSIVYRADLTRFREVMLFMLRDCCDGRPEICAPLIDDLTCCPPNKSRIRRKIHV
jgi:ArsR family transcriptional regulator, arsenate/arsenite/antimonite-responsive transcriptional repressor